MGLPTRQIVFGLPPFFLLTPLPFPTPPIKRTCLSCRLRVLQKQTDRLQEQANALGIFVF